MPPDYAVPFDILTRITKFVKEDTVYAIIVAETHYATVGGDDDRVKIIETKSDPDVAGPTGIKKAVLIETPWDAGEDFATLSAGDIAPPPDGELEEFVSEWVYCLVVPKSEEAKSGWFDMYVRPISKEGEMPDDPFLWITGTMSINDPVTINFKIRYEPHLTNGPDGEGTDPMVQMYPTSGTCSAQTGYSLFVYRTDSEGTGPNFGPPPEWEADTVANIPIFESKIKGLSFGTDPPLIAADVPYEE